MNLFTETAILRVRGQVTSTDRYGREVREPDVDTPWPAWWEPRGHAENVAAAEQYVSGYWLYLPLDAPAFDVIVGPDGGHEFQAVGKPGRQPAGFIVEGFQTMAIEDVEG